MSDPTPDMNTSKLYVGKSRYTDGDCTDTTKWERSFIVSCRVVCRTHLVLSCLFAGSRFDICVARS